MENSLSRPRIRLETRARSVLTIVPNGSPIDKTIAIDWSSVNVIQVADNSVSFQIPQIVIKPSTTGFIILEGCEVVVPRNNRLLSTPYAMDGYVIAFKYVEDLGKNPMLAMGIIREPK
jgi:hypothetical protein